MTNIYWSKDVVFSSGTGFERTRKEKMWVMVGDDPTDKDSYEYIADSYAVHMEYDTSSRPIASYLIGATLADGLIVCDKISGLPPTMTKGNVPSDSIPEEVIATAKRTAIDTYPAAGGFRLLRALGVEIPEFEGPGSLKEPWEYIKSTDVATRIQDVRNYHSKVRAHMLRACGLDSEIMSQTGTKQRE